MDNVFEIINTDSFADFNHAHEFINQLTNHSTPTREAVALKLEDIIKDNINYFLDDFSIQKINDAIIDINPNVSRAICSILSKNKEFHTPLEDKIILKIESILEDLLNSGENAHLQNNKSHAKNKKMFALYWLLEALSICQSPKNTQKILKILNVTINFCDYTIREKTAKILSLMDNPPDELLQKANIDQNFYVKMQVYDRMRKSK